MILARVPITPLTLESFSNTFNLYPYRGLGGCDRNSPDGIPMLEHTLKSLGGALAVAQTVTQDLPSYPTQIYIRGLLFLFFGITFQRNHELNPDSDNVNAYNSIANTFSLVNQVFINPTDNVYNIKPRYRCLEDYANYYTHMVNDMGLQDFSQPLIGEYFDYTIEGGFTRPPPYNDIWPGLMFVNNYDHSNAWYLPMESSPPNGACGPPDDEGVDRTSMFTDVNCKKTDDSQPGTAPALFGITACSIHFDYPPLLDLGTPVPNGEATEIRKFTSVADVEDLHELIHLVSDGVIIDQSAMIPPGADPDNVLTSNQWVTNRNWASWVPSAIIGAYGYFYTMFLGLSRPAIARFNADSYANFAICMYFTELNCLGYFETDILTKRSVPAGVSPRAVEKIRSGGFDMKKDLGLGQEPAEAEAEDVGKGFKGKDQSRFKDVFRPSALFG